MPGQLRLGSINSGPVDRFNCPIFRRPCSSVGRFRPISVLGCSSSWGLTVGLSDLPPLKMGRCRPMILAGVWRSHSITKIPRCLWLAFMGAGASIPAHIFPCSSPVLISPRLLPSGPAQPGKKKIINSLFHLSLMHIFNVSGCQ